MDALSEVLRGVGLTGGVFVEAEFTAPWWVAGQMAREYCRPFMEPPEQIVCFHYVVEGDFEIHIDGGDAARLRAGQIVMLPMNDLHYFGSAKSRTPVNTADLMQVSPEGIARLEYGGGGERTRLVCGFLGGNAQLRPMLSGLPRLLVLDVATLPAGDWMRRTFAYAAQTLSAGDPGAGSVLAKMSELLFVEAIRQYLRSLPETQTGWFAGLRDPVVGKALALMHAEVGKPWTAEALADAVGLSRSAFADRFTALIGVPPMRYLTQWRMQVARTRLRETRASIAAIAFDVGYESEAAFARAFRREVGAPPGAWRKDGAGAGPAPAAPAALSQ